MGKWIKRIFLGIGILLLLVLLAAVLIPILFKDRIEAAMKEQVNASLNATVDWGEWDLSILSSFPNASFSISDVKVCNRAPFEGICLARIGELQATVGVMSLFGDRILIKRVAIIRPDVHAKVLPDGRANWDIALADSAATETPADTSATLFNVKLSEYSITDGHLIYDDASLPMLMDLAGLDHTGKGDFTQDLFVLSTNTHADSATVVFDGIKSLKNVTADIKADLDMDMPNMKFTFKENEATINQLVLGFDGWVAMPTDDIDMDLKWDLKKTDFGTLLSLVPAEFASDLKGVDMTGKAAFNGYVKGTYNDNTMPGFGLHIGVDNGRFKYPDLPASCENIFVDCGIVSPQGKDLDGMVVDLKRFALKLAGNPVEARMLLKTPMSDPDVDAVLKADVDLANVKKVVPLGKDELNGALKADVTMVGRMSDVEAQGYEKFKAEGTLQLKGMAYRSDSLPYGIGISELLFRFSPKFLELAKYDGTVGGSDLHASGRIDNYLQWWLKDSTIVGTFNVNSAKFDLNELMGPETAADTSASTSDTAQLSVIEVPKNIDFRLNTAVKQVRYDDLTLNDVKGALHAHDQRVDLKDIFFKLFNGNATMNGSYTTKDPNAPRIDLDYDVRDFDIEQTVTYVETVQKLAPIAKNCKGAFSTDLRMTGVLDAHMMPVMSSLTGDGTLRTRSVRLSGVKVLEEVNKFLKNPKLDNPTLQDVNFSYEFRDGKMITKKFPVKLDQMAATVEGWTAFEDQSIEYRMTAKVPTAMFGAAANQTVSGLLGQAGGLIGTKFELPKEIDMSGMITGTVLKPVFKPVFGGGGSNLKETVITEVKETLNEEIGKKKEELIAQAKAERDRLIAEAQKQADDLKAKARAEAANLKAQAYKAADDELAKVTNPLAKVAAKLVADKAKQAADKKEQEALAAASKKADGIVDLARQKGDDLVKKAEATDTTVK
ncbi:MAG TPA: AsmA-like C-terminal region-containing protein [Flavobacteriales bacterium]|nr:AsmA-like C-terminal region-containing protein [Flavobacteriales bacterium]